MICKPRDVDLPPVSADDPYSVHYDFGMTCRFLLLAKNSSRIQRSNDSVKGHIGGGGVLFGCLASLMQSLHM